MLIGWSFCIRDPLQTVPGYAYSLTWKMANIDAYSYAYILLTSYRVQIRIKQVTLRVVIYETMWTENYAAGMTYRQYTGALLCNAKSNDVRRYLRIER